MPASFSYYSPTTIESTVSLSKYNSSAYTSLHPWRVTYPRTYLEYTPTIPLIKSIALYSPPTYYLSHSRSNYSAYYKDHTSYHHHVQPTPTSVASSLSLDSKISNYFTSFPRDIIRRSYYVPYSSYISQYYYPYNRYLSSYYTYPRYQTIYPQSYDISPNASISYKYNYSATSAIPYTSYISTYYHSYPLKTLYNPTFSYLNYVLPSSYSRWHYPSSLYSSSYTSKHPLTYSRSSYYYDDYHYYKALSHQSYPTSASLTYGRFPSKFSSYYDAPLSHHYYNSSLYDTSFPYSAYRRYLQPYSYLY